MSENKIGPAKWNDEQKERFAKSFKFISEKSYDSSAKILSKTFVHEDVFLALRLAFVKHAIDEISIDKIVSMPEFADMGGVEMRGILSMLREMVEKASANGIISLWETIRTENNNDMTAKINAEVEKEELEAKEIAEEISILKTKVELDEMKKALDKRDKDIKIREDELSEKLEKRQKGTKMRIGLDG